MIGKPLRSRDLLEHIRESIERIERYLSNSLIQDAVIRNLEVIGEAANKISILDKGFTLRNQHLRLAQAYGMRNALVHGYYSINLLTIWQTINNDLPLLKAQVAEILDGG